METTMTTTTFIANAFSLSMLSLDADAGAITFRRLTLAEAREIAEQPHTSCVGHADTARMMSAELGMSVEPNRCSVQLRHGDRMLVAQYSGPRLPEGATELPEGAAFRWMLVELPQTHQCSFCGFRNYGSSWHCAGCGAC